MGAIPLTLKQYEQYDPKCAIDVDDVRAVFYTPTSVTKWRVQTLFSKEPITIEWIARMRADEVLVDIGANVGMYAIWAARSRGVKVFAFEPEAQNYAVLNRNIYLNDLSERMRAYCLGLSDCAGLSELHLSHFKIGGSCHSVGEAVDFNHQPMRPAFTQGCVSARLDDLVSDGTVPVPTHIKLDVDGFEPRVIAGAWTTLHDPRVRSLLIEVNQNLADHRGMVAELGGLGFRYDPDQVAAAERQGGAFKGVAEYVFDR